MSSATPYTACNILYYSSYCGILVREMKPPDVAEAAEKTGLVIRGLQTRLQERSFEPPAETTSDDLENQLKEYFEHHPREERPESGRLNQLRDRVINGVAD